MKSFMGVRWACVGAAVPRLHCVVAALGVLLVASQGQAQDVLLRGATVHTVSGETLFPGDVLIRDGRIEAVGASLDAPGATVIELGGRHLYPGLIAPMSSLGLTEIGAVRATRDTDEVGGWAPDVLAPIAVNPDSELIPVARANGYTHALTVPHGGTVSGHSGLLALDGWTWEEMTVRSPAALHVFWPGMELDLTPREESRRPDEWKPPEKQAEERRARLKEIDDFFEEAKAYAKGREAGTIPDTQVVPAWEAMRPALRGDIPVFLHTGEERQIRAALAWAAGEGLKRVVLAGGRDAARCADLLAKHQVPVIYDSTFGLPPRDTDRYDVQFTAPATLQKAGVTVIFSNGSGGWGAADLRNVPYHAAQAVAFGLSEGEALKGLTLYPARILGVEKRLGSIEKGKEATLFVASGSILDIRSEVTRMWIGGKEVKLESRHTKLYEKYKGRPKGK